MTSAKKDTGVWEVLKGINYPPGNKRAEVGESVSDLSADNVADFLSMDAIAPQDASAKKIAAALAAAKK